MAYFIISKLYKNRNNKKKRLNNMFNLFFLSGRQDSNLRPPVPKTGALPDCATPRCNNQELYFSIEEVTFLICGCKGSTFSRTYQTFM